MKPTDGLQRGTVVRNTGHGITMPVGDGVLGHVFNVIGEPLDIERVEAHRASTTGGRSTATRRRSTSSSRRR